MQQQQDKDSRPSQWATSGVCRRIKVKLSGLHVLSVLSKNHRSYSGYKRGLTARFGYVNQYWPDEREPLKHCPGPSTKTFSSAASPQVHPGVSSSADWWLRPQNHLGDYKQQLTEWQNSHMPIEVLSNSTLLTCFIGIDYLDSYMLTRDKSLLLCQGRRKCSASKKTRKYFHKLHTGHQRVSDALCPREEHGAVFPVNATLFFCIGGVCSFKINKLPLLLGRSQ